MPVKQLKFSYPSILQRSESHCGHTWLLLFLIITLDSPILDRVTAIQLLREASNSPSPTLYEQCVGSLTSHRIYVGKGWETGPSPFIALIREN